MATIPDGDGSTDPVAAARAGDPAAQGTRRAARSLRDYQPESGKPERHAPMTTPMVPVTINGVVERPGGDSAEPGKPGYLIMLTETGGDRRMWIGVGRAEATALALSLSGVDFPRPQTYQFTAALLAASGARLREVRITALTNDVFYAQAVLASGTVVDARPSDALNLAAISDAPVYVAAGLLER